MRRVRVCKFGGGISRQPLLTCKRSDYNIQAFFAWKYKSGTSGDKEVYLEGKDAGGSRKVDFSENANGYTGTQASGVHGAWSLKVFKSGTARLSTFQDGYDAADFHCDKQDVFVVTKSETNMGGDWEKPIKDVKLTLENCKKDSKVEKCDISIESSVGLGWNPKFKPKAIFK